MAVAMMSNSEFSGQDWRGKQRFLEEDVIGKHEFSKPGGYRFWPKLQSQKDRSVLSPVHVTDRTKYSDKLPLLGFQQLLAC